MKTKESTFRSCFVLVIIFAMMSGATVFAEEESEKDKKKDRLAEAAVFTPDRYAILNINNLWAWQREDGLSNHSPEGNDGVFFPRNTTSLIYQDGIIWGAKAFVDAAFTLPAPFGQTIRVGGANYGTGSQEGWIEGFGATAIPADTNDLNVRLYRIRRNWLELSDEVIKQDAADCFEIPASQVTDTQIQIIADDYLWSWENWPVDHGAPYIDRNNNGLYDPPPPFKTDIPKSDPLYFGPADLIDGGYDEPGLAGADQGLPADQVIWSVWNDLNRSLRFGSEPTGMEVQSTLWGYQRKDALGDVIFRKIKFINKGGVEIDEVAGKGAFFLDSMYVCQWVDPDLGLAGNDLAGCDTTLNMGFVYNGDEIDSKYQNFGLPPPSVGYDIMQGPVIPSPGNAAIFDLKLRQNFINLGMTGFFNKGSGSPFSDPSNINYSTGAMCWYKTLRGFVWLSGADVYYPVPPGGVPGPFPFAGDPVTATGHIDGLGNEYSYIPGDRRIVCSSGPWQMAPGDTQEVVIALVCGLGADRLSSISVMKFNDRYAQKFYDSLLSLKTPEVSVQTYYPTNTATEFQAQVNLNQFFNVTNAQINLTPRIGSELEINLTLFDDGLHNDSLAGDNIWGNSGIYVNRKYPFKADLIVFTNAGTETLPVLSDLRLRPKPKLTNWRISWENGRQDLSINNHEKVHLKFDILNQDNVNNIDLIKIINQTPGANFQTVRYNKVILPGNNEINDSLFLELKAPSFGDSMTFTYQIMYDSFSGEPVSVTYPVLPWEPGPVWGDTLAVISQTGVTCNVIPIIADPALLTGHRYQVSFYTYEDQLLWRLTDNTADLVKLENASPANFSLFPHPVIDGIQFIVLDPEPAIKSFECVSNAAGSINPPTGAAADFQNFPVPERPGPSQQVGAGQWMINTHKYGASNYRTFDHFLARSFVSNGLAAIIPNDLEIRFTAAGGKAFDNWGAEVMVDVPFELWFTGRDEDPADDYRLFCYMLDNNSDGVFNLAWGSADADHGASDGTDDPFTDRMYWLAPTDNTPGTQGYDNLITSITNNPGGRPGWAESIASGSEAWSIVTRMVLVNLDGGDVMTATSPADYNMAMPETGTTFRIVTSKPNLPGDLLIIDAPVSVSDDNNLPNSFYLYQNFPNPFNPATHIRFNLAKPADVKLEIFNLLGQKVATLIDKKMTAGKHSIIWNGRSKNGTKLGSGIYFYRIKAGAYIKTHKMTLLK